MIKKIITSIFITILLGTSVNAQRTLLNRIVSDDVYNQQRGPNQKHYLAQYIGLGMRIPSGEDYFETKDYNGLSFTYGQRYKRKFAKNYAIVTDLYYFFDQYRPKETGMINPKATLSDKESIRLSGLGFSFANRFNFFRTGNHLGKYFEIGAYVNWNIGRNHRFIYYHEDDSYSKILYKKLDYFSCYEYGLTAAIGLNKVRFYATYRLSTLLTEPLKIPDLPVILAGIQMDISSNIDRNN